MAEVDKGLSKIIDKLKKGLEGSTSNLDTLSDAVKSVTEAMVGDAKEVEESTKAKKKGRPKGSKNKELDESAGKAAASLNTMSQAGAAMAGTAEEIAKPMLSLNSGVAALDNYVVEAFEGGGDFKELGGNFKNMMEEGMANENDFTRYFDDIFEDMGQGMANVDFSATFKEGGDAIKTLTGGLIDINDIVDDGMKIAKAAWTTLTMPFKLVNDSIKAVSGFFGKEIDLGKMAKKYLSKGLKMLTNGLKTLGGAFIKTAGVLIKQAGLMIVRAAVFTAGLIWSGMALLATGASMIVTSIVGFLTPAFLFIGGLIAAGVAMLAAAIPMILAAAPIIGIALLIGLGVAALVWAGMKLYDMFQENKDFIYAKFNSMWQGVKGIIESVVGFFTGIWQSISDFIRSSFLKIKSFLGLTSDEEEKELEGIKSRAAAKEANREAAQSAAMTELEGDKEYQDADKRTKAKMLKEKQAAIFQALEQEREFQGMNTDNLVEARQAKEEELEGKLQAMNERNDYIAKTEEEDTAARVKAIEDIKNKTQEQIDSKSLIVKDINGVVLEGDARRLAIEALGQAKLDGVEAKRVSDEEKLVKMRADAEMGILRDAEGGKVGGDEYWYKGQSELDKETTDLGDDVNTMQSVLDKKEDYVPSYVLSDMDKATKMGYTPEDIELASKNTAVKEDGLIQVLEDMAIAGDLSKDYDGQIVSAEEVDMFSGGDQSQAGEDYDSRALSGNYNDLNDEKALGQQGGGQVALQNNFSNANTINNSHTMQDPSTQNNEPTGTRLSVVPA